MHTKEDGGGHTNPTLPVQKAEKAVRKALRRLTKSMESASVDDVCLWLVSIGMPETVLSAFREHGIDGELTDDAAKPCGQQCDAAVLPATADVSPVSSRVHYAQAQPSAS